MLFSLIHPGSGLGNQLFRYVAGKVRAKKLGVPYSAVGRENFKGKSFMGLDFGPENDVKYHVEYPAGKIIVENKPLWEEKTNYYNPEFNFVEDGTAIDGEFQDLRYFEDMPPEQLLRWFNIREDLLAGFYDEICVIGYRGGEFKLFPELYLTKDYWDEAIRLIRIEKPDVVFKVVTDDPEEAKKMFPDFQVGNEIGDDWTSILHAHYLIIANSSFYIFPALLNTNAKKIIAPRYWARHNTKEWSMPQNYYRKFKYV